MAKRRSTKPKLTLEELAARADRIRKHTERTVAEMAQLRILIEQMKADKLKR
jgi:t-SNARE complex subunit (syntaxin)